ncbi:MAG: helix-turn-helix domain-containing protein [Clostridia bacterium]|nr:helix-turn-helix domain-containing protein [Clostridia bacterium]
MIKISKRIEELRKERGLSAYQLCNELGFPKMSIEKFEAGKLTPTKLQQEKIARFFGVSTDYLTGENDDTMTQWIRDDERQASRQISRQSITTVPKKTVKQQSETQSNTGSMMDAFANSEVFKKAVLEVLKTPEGMELIRKALCK